jgi:transcriptional regulator with XRE-family HTH domain
MRYKTEAQAEFNTLFRKLTQAGWTAADTARAIGITKTAIYHYRMGLRSPRRVILNCIRTLADNVTGDTAHPSTPRDAIQQKIEFLLLHDRASFKALRRIVDVLHRRAFGGRAPLPRRLRP